MSWHFSRALVEAFSGGLSSGGGACVPSSAIPTHGMCWSPGKTTEASRPSRSGMTYEPLTDGLGEGLLTWSLEASRARTSARPERVPALMENVPASGPRWRALSARYDRGSCSWRTHQCLFDEALPESSVTLPRWGMMRAGALWERTTPGLPTGATASGLWPTPTVQDAKNNGGPSQYRRRTPPLNALARMFPTPRTPSRSGGGTGLDGGSGARAMLTEQERRELTGGQLNPAWIEWLMGWPLGWTGCAVSATGRFRQWLHSHGGS